MASTLAGQQTAAPTATAAPQNGATTAPSALQVPQPSNSTPLNKPVSKTNSPAQAPTSQAAATNQTAPAQPGISAAPRDDPKDVAAAKHQFKAGVKLKSSGNLDAAFEKFELAAQLAPHNVKYLTAREFTRQQLVTQALKQGNQAMLDHNEVVAMANFRRALEYDPTNEYALQRLRDSMPLDEKPLSENMRVVEQSTPVEMQPAAKRHDFHFRGDARAMLTQVARAYGITAQFDDSVQQRRVRFDIEDVNFATAMEAATRVTKTFWVPLSARQMLFAADTIENRRTYERMSLRTFYLPDLTGDQELTEMTNSLRVLFNLRYIAADKAQSTISVRAEEPVVEAAGQLLESLSGGRPEVLLDLRVYEVSSSFLRQLGTTLPPQFTLFNINPSLIAGLGQNSQNLINQLIASGGINQANSQTIQALLASLPSQTSSILSTPFATFGGGLTLMALTGLGTGATVAVNLNESDIRSLDHVTLRASQNDAAVFKVGERYPIVNATFAPIYNSSAISQVLGNQSYIAPVPSVNYEDLGLNLKATPVIHTNRDVTLKLELNIRSLGTQTVNGIPIINNREYTGSITLKSGESSVVTGLISSADARSISGYPFLSTVPALTYAASEHTKNNMEDELLVVITPHILRLSEANSFVVQLPSGH
ncbi:MAG: type II and III secretion system protein [Candidatus Korobacteraceae bacterium]